MPQETNQLRRIIGAEVAVGLGGMFAYGIGLNLEAHESPGASLWILIALSVARSFIHGLVIIGLDRYLNRALTKLETDSARNAEEILNFHQFLSWLPGFYSLGLSFFCALTFVVHFILIGLFLDVEVDTYRILFLILCCMAYIFGILANRSHQYVDSFYEHYTRCGLLLSSLELNYDFQDNGLVKRTRSMIIILFICTVTFVACCLVYELDSLRDRRVEANMKHYARVVQRQTQLNGIKNNNLDELKGFFPPTVTVALLRESGAIAAQFGPLIKRQSYTLQRGLSHKLKSLEANGLNGKWLFVRSLERGIYSLQIDESRLIIIDSEQELLSGFALWFMSFPLALSIVVALTVSKYYTSRFVRPINNLRRVCLNIFNRGQINSLDLVPIVENDETGELTQAFNAVLIRMKELSRIAEAVATGELDVTVSANGDLNLAFRQMISNLRQTVGEISGESEALVKRGTRFVQASKKQQTLSENQASTLNNVADAFTSYLGSIRKMSDSVTRVVQSARSNKRGADELVESVDQFSQTVSEIKSVLGVIRRISHQSRMLALNIEIESRRFSDQNLGMNAIASEARRLNELIDDSVKNVKGLLNTMSEALLAANKKAEGNRSFVAETIHLAESFNQFAEVQESTVDDLKGQVQSVATGINQGVSRARSYRAEAEELYNQARRLTQSLRRIHKREAESHDAALFESISDMGYE